MFCKHAQTLIHTVKRNPMPFAVKCPHCQPPPQNPRMNGYLGNGLWIARHMRTFKSNRYGDKRDVGYRHFMVFTRQKSVLERLWELGFKNGDSENE